MDKALLLEDYELEDELQAMTGSMLRQENAPQRAKFSLPKPPAMARKAIQLGSPHGQGPAPAWVKRRANAAAAQLPPQACAICMPLTDAGCLHDLPRDLAQSHITQKKQLKHDAPCCAI